jgi:hypothetical protein
MVGSGEQDDVVLGPSRGYTGFGFWNIFCCY